MSCRCVACCCVVLVLSCAETSAVGCEEDAVELLQDSHHEKGFVLLEAYPNQYVAQRLHTGQSVQIDGNLNETVWEEVPFTDSAFKDIAQPRFPSYVLPSQYATQVKVRWDAEYLYVGAFIGEPWVETGFVRGSNPSLTSSNPIYNSNVPYYDNDFEVFVDVAGSNHWYKDFRFRTLRRAPSIPNSDLSNTSLTIKIESSTLPSHVPWAWMVPPLR